MLVYSALMRIPTNPPFCQPTAANGSPVAEAPATVTESVTLGESAQPGLLPSPRELAASRGQEAEGPIRDINQPGECVDVQANLVPGKSNIICYWATWCPWSQKAQPKLLKLCTEKPEYVCLRVDIATFKSPVAAQYGITKVPSFAIYGPDGQVVAEGEEARARVNQLFEETGSP